jgi:NDP-sugar pyrophosphorylase family protein
VILAGGIGERLKPLTNVIPKPMIRMNGIPFLEYLIRFLKKNKIEEVVLLLGYLPDKITEYFGDGSK